MGLLARPKSMVPKESKWACLHMASSPMRTAKGSGAKVAGFLLMAETLVVRSSAAKASSNDLECQFSGGEGA